MSKFDPGHQDLRRRLQQGFRGLSTRPVRRRFNFRRIYWRVRAFSGLIVLAVFALPALLVAVPNQGVSVHPAHEPYYANCDAARAAGVAPILAGQPGYRPWLDADNDGIACEPFGW